MMTVEEIIRLASELPALGVAQVSVGDVTLVFGTKPDPEWDKEAREEEEPSEYDLLFHSAGGS